MKPHEGSERVQFQSVSDVLIANTPMEECFWPLTFLILNLGFDIFDGVTGLDL